MRRDTEKATAYLEPELKRDLQLLAKAHGHSLNSEIHIALMAHCFASADEIFALRDLSATDGTADEVPA